MRTQKKDTLIDRCLRGDRDAQNELYQREVHGVFHLVIRLVANRMDAEDLTRECFIKVLLRDQPVVQPKGFFSFSPLKVGRRQAGLTGGQVLNTW